MQLGCTSSITVSLKRKLDLHRAMGPGPRSVSHQGHAVPPPHQLQAALLLTHLCLDRVRLPDMSDWFQKATLSFCLRHYQTRHFISQVFQLTPEPSGLLTALERKGRRVRSPEHLGERLAGALGDQSTTGYRCLLWGFVAAKDIAPTFLFSGCPVVAFTQSQTDSVGDRGAVLTYQIQHGTLDHPKAGA